MLYKYIYIYLHTRLANITLHKNTSYTIHTQGVEKLLSEEDIHIATGPDNISCRILQGLKLCILTDQEDYSTSFTKSERVNSIHQHIQRQQHP